MKLPTKLQLERLRRQYPTGARVELIHMNDCQSPPVGTCGTILGIDAIGDVLVRWDNGSMLSLIPDVDECRVLPVCPLCGKAYTGHPALSRADNQSAICPDCGTRQAMEAAKLKPETQEKIMDMIHANE